MGSKMIKTTLVTLICLAPTTSYAQVFSATDQEIDAYVIADRNQDGYLSLTEFRTFVQAMAKAGQPTAKTIRTFGAYRFAFGIVDVNKDHRASPEELRAADDDYRAN